MTIEVTKIEGLDAFALCGAMRAPGLGELDPITVILQDHGEGRGTLIVTCFTSAWTCYWGDMGCNLRSFIASSFADYIAGCLIRGRNLKNQRTHKVETKYLVDIARAIKASIKTEAEHG